ncbi:hypothetical protein BKE38_08435 [Pseudoroseomonas deserti]|uniref:DUF4126 domain-containing protein n=1 Tax=Teichococcus deserti TaxID=1817963 RepID=A0A1V2H6Q5_9PROT|nr:hypothetical protein [Pseudoroseomonas deserti]ONG55803.1 hypothetical protein BKE38_08435 [Pseudoroseomonas deserti]
MTPLLLALLAGCIAGLRSIMPLAALALAALAGWLALTGWTAWLAAAPVAWLLAALALGELVTDKLPSTPSRKVPLQFGGRLLSGALCGMMLGMPAGVPGMGAMLGAAGAVIGTLGSAAARGRLAARLRHDWPAALIEDAAALILTLLLVGRLA